MESVVSVLVQYSHDIKRMLYWFIDMATWAV